MRFATELLASLCQTFRDHRIAAQRERRKRVPPHRSSAPLQFETLEARTVLSGVEITQALGYAFEGDNSVTLLFRATTDIGEIASYEVDIDNDGFWDASISDHSEEIGGLLVDVGLFNLLGSPVDQGTYSARLRVTNTEGGWQDSLFDISVANVLPAVTAQGPEHIQPGQVFTLIISISDPGPDTVTSLTIEWGDGTSETHAAGSGDFDHVYTADAVYTIRITATDEDGTWSLEQHRTNIGDTDADEPESNLPEVISASAEILPSGNAEITIEAVDSQGNPIASFHWDLDGDGVYEYAGGPTVVLSPIGGFYPYVARVRLIDSLGNTSDVLIAFLGAGPADIIATISNYAALFRKQTPDLPGDWQVHHTLQVGRQDVPGGTEKILADRFWTEKGINVHDSKHLRGLPPKIHAEITGVQTRWWNAKMAELQVTTLEEAYRRVPLDDVIAFSNKIETEYAGWWLKSGKNQSRLVTRITNGINKAGAQWNFIAGKAGRLRNLGFSIPAGLGIFAVVANNGRAMANIAHHNAEQQQALAFFLQRYEHALDQQIATGHVPKGVAELLVDSFIDYQRALELDEGIVFKIREAMYAYITLNP